MNKKGLHFVEKTPGSDDRFKSVITPAMGYFGIPVLDLPDGTFISDTTAIIRYLEEQHPEPAMQPADPVMNAINWLIFNFGTEGLFLNAQHYRWSFKDSAKFAASDIGRGLATPNPNDEAAIKKDGANFQNMKLARFPDEVGITEETIPAIEAFNALVFAKLDMHFRYYPYILGGRPSVADAALMEALHAHQGRDPYAAHIMKMTAPVLYRWTETMNRTGIQDAELPDVPQEFISSDNLPYPLIEFLRLVCKEFGAQVAATAKAYEDWLDMEPGRPEGAIITNDPGSLNRQAMGKMEYMLEGVRVRRDAWPDVINMHQYVLEVVDAMDDAQKARWTEIMKMVGGEVFLDYRPSRPVVIKKDQEPYQFVLGPQA
jgi:glutathione S-transferase